MDTYFDSYTSYRADLDYRREQLVGGLDAIRGTRRARRNLRSTLTPASSVRSSRAAARTHFARSA